MRIPKIAVLWALPALLSLASQALASWAYVAPELYVDEAEAIVVGKMTRVEKYEGTGVIAVTEVIKGDPDLKEVKARFSALPRPVKDGAMVWRSDTISYPEGREGVWILLAAHRDENGAYALNMPNVSYRTEDAQKVRDMLAELERQPWSEPVKGLAARTLFHRPPNAPFGMLHLAVRNAGEEPLRVSDYHGHRLVEAVIVEPDGTKRNVDLYSSLESRRLAPPKVDDFPLLRPGERRYVVFRYGFNTGPLDKQGVYEFRLTYRNTHDGSGLEIENVWTGEVAAPVVKFENLPAAP
jgi:hypothetical protein